MARSALDRVPTAPFDFRRTIYQQWVPLHPNGTFTAKLKLSTPKTIPAGARWGVYTYGAAGADNASQELSVPVGYSTAPGPNTPKPPARNLLWSYSPSFHRTVTGTTQGSVTGSAGAVANAVFHATGIGGRTMEKLADSGMLAGIIDIAAERQRRAICRTGFRAALDVVQRCETRSGAGLRRRRRSADRRSGEQSVEPGSAGRAERTESAAQRARRAAGLHAADAGRACHDGW